MNAANPRTVPLRSYYVLAVLTAVNTLNFIDRKLPFILIENIKKDLHLNDTQIGLIGGLMFSMVYAVFSLPIGRLADSYPRKRIVAGAVALWSLMTGVGAFTQTFLQLAATRMGVAVGEAGSTPPSHSLLADYFPISRRAGAIAIFMAGSSIGGMIGLALGGWLNEVANWRTAMLIVGVPGLLLAALVALTIREPERGATEAARSAATPAERPTLRETLATLVKRKSFRHIAAGCALYTFGSTAFSSFVPAYLIRSFGMTTTFVGVVYGITSGGVGGLGSLIGGFLGDRLGARDVRWNLWLPAIAWGVSVPFLVGACFATTGWSCILLLVVPHMVGTFYLGPSFALGQSLVSVRMRALTSAIIMFAMYGLGGSFGPFLAGALSDYFRPRFGQDSLRIALMIMSLAWPWAALHFVLGARHLRADRAAAELASRAA